MIHDTPLVSVIVPSYNHEPYLRQRIDSLIGQTFQDYEIILLDDCSTDNSADLLLTYEDHPKVSHVIINDINSGSPFGMWQTGLSLAKGDYIWIAESDDFAQPDFLERTIPILNADKTISLAYTDSKIIDTNGNAIGFWHENKNSFFDTERWSKNYQNNGLDEIIDYLLYRVTINNVSAVLFRKQQLLKMNFRVLVSFKNVGDLFTYCNTLFKGHIAYVALPLNNYRVHSGNTTKKHTRSGLFYSDALKCYRYVISHIMADPNGQTKKKRIAKATKYIINRFGFKLTDNGYLKELVSFMQIAKTHHFFSKLDTVKLISLFKMYSISSGKIKSGFKNAIRADLNKQIYEIDN